MMKYIIKFSYDGSSFSGYQRGNGERSVEDTIQKELDKLAIDSRIRSAARTDRGVSAIANVFLVEYEDSIEKLMGLLNSRISDITFHSFASVENNFNPRHCTMKWYRYYLSQEINKSGLKMALEKFIGTHDFRNFCRSDGRNTVRSIHSIRVGTNRGYVYVDFYAQSFLWQQIRSIMAYALHHSESQENSDPFEAKTRYGKIASPQPLILMDINYESVKFTSFRSGSKEKFLSKKLSEMRSRFIFLDLETEFLRDHSNFTEKQSDDVEGSSGKA